MLAASPRWQPVCLRGLSDGEGQRSWQDANGRDANELRANKQAFPSPHLTSDLISCLFNNLTGKMRRIQPHCQKTEKKKKNWIAGDFSLLSTYYSFSNFICNLKWSVTHKVFLFHMNFCKGLVKFPPRKHPIFTTELDTFICNMWILINLSLTVDLLYYSLF